MNKNNIYIILFVAVFFLLFQKGNASNVHEIKSTDFFNIKGNLPLNLNIATQDTLKKEKVCIQKLRGKVFLNATQKIIGNAVVKLKDEKGLFIKKYKTTKNARFVFDLECNKKYQVEASANGYFLSKRAIKSSSKDKVENHKNLFLTKKAKRGEKKKYLYIGEVDFDYNEWSLLPQFTYEVDKAITSMKENSNLFIHFESHTDSRGETDFNWELTDKRIAVLKEYLGYHKIYRNRISGQSFGETKPLNKCVRDVQCTDREHLENRRTKFYLTEKKIDFTPIKRLSKVKKQKDSLVLSKVDMKNCSQKLEGTLFLNATRKKIGKALVSLKDGDGNFLKEYKTSKNSTYQFKLKCNKDYQIESSSLGYENSKRVLKTSVKNNVIVVKNLFINKALKNGEKRDYLLMGEAGFEFNEWEILPRYMYEIDKAIAVMKENPKLFIHFESHTDSRGTSEFNWDLTDKRIAKLKEYVGFHKIYRNRISGQSFGEIKPVNKCVKGVKCSDSEFLENRRTTFILTEKKVEFTPIKREKVKVELVSPSQSESLKNCIQVLEGTILLNGTRKKIPNAFVTLKDSKGEVLDQFQTNKNAKYNFVLKCNQDYRIEASLRGYETSKRLLKASAKDKSTKHKNLFLNKALKNGETRDYILMGEADFEYNEWKMLPRYMYELDKAIAIMQENSNLYIHFESHTDSRGKTDFNWDLTDKRIAKLKEYVSSHKIFRKRITGQSFGETKPVNKCVKGVTCTDKEFLENRRTTFILTEKKVKFTPIKREKAIEEEPSQTELTKNCIQKLEGTIFLNATRKKIPNVFVTLKDSHGEVLDQFQTNKNAKYNFVLKCNQDYRIEASLRGYETSKRLLKASAKDKSIKSKNLFLNKALKNGEKRDYLLMGEVDFEFNEWDLLAIYKYELDKAITIMQENPNLFIHFESHTDSRGETDFNWDLTDKRIAKLKEYVESHKIFRKRITGQSFGETKPSNKCVKGVTCTDLEFLENRRTTFIITEKKVEFTPIKRAIKKVISKEKPDINTTQEIPNCFQELKGTVFLNVSRKKIKNALISLQSNGVEVDKFQTNTNATYNFKLKCNKNYQIESSVSGYENSKRMFKTSLINNKIVSKNLFINKNGGKNKYLYIGEVGFEYNKSDLLPRYMYELDKAIAVMIENPKLVIHFESHTDSRAGTEFNKDLTDQRVMALKEYVGYHKIYRDRITVNSFGETKPLNKCVKGVRCTDKEFLLNRRTTFILKEK